MVPSLLVLIGPFAVGFLALLAFLTMVLAVLTMRTLRIAIDGRLLAG